MRDNGPKAAGRAIGVLGVRGAGDENPGDVKDQIRALKQEINELKPRIVVFDVLCDVVEKQARETHTFETQNEKLRSEIERLRRAVAALDAVPDQERPAK